MQLLASRNGGSGKERGAALLITFLVMIVVLMIVYQVNRITATEQIDADRTLTLTRMNLAIQSAQQQVEQDLLTDAQADAEEDTGAGAGDGEGGLPMGDPEGEAGGDESSAPVDSFNDDWATIQATVIGEQNLSVYVVDEDRKFNILGMLSEDEEEALEAEAIVTRILDRCREGTRVDIPSGLASDMARAMKA
ncbi:MAG: hypothetical protein KDB61_05770, partial [Planctomycetes bacterium]|nr:hypothetical protein [Planctomycetota bacterium]